jgi:hypothetical protein
MDAAELHHRGARLGQPLEVPDQPPGPDQPGERLLDYPPLRERRIESVDELREELEPWYEERNDRAVGAKWRFTTADARIKLRRPYPAIEWWWSTST